MSKDLVHEDDAVEARSGPALYLIATPIGNLEDITLRALRLLKEVDRIACEDTRRTARLLQHYAITTPRESHHSHNEAASTQRLLEILRRGGQIALVTDAGTPLVSDPGYALVAACRQEGVPVIPVPGPSAAIAALTGSGLPTDSFCFAGFLPARQGQRRRRLEELAPLRCTLVFYEAPHRILAALADMHRMLGPRRACLARELTKLHEEWIHGTIPEIRSALEKRERIRGEITLVVDGAGSRAVAPPEGYPESISLHLLEEMRATGRERGEALKAVAAKRGLSRKEAYRLLVEERSAKD